MSSIFFETENLGFGNDSFADWEIPHIDKNPQNNDIVNQDFSISARENHISEKNKSEIFPMQSEKFSYSAPDNNTKKDFFLTNGISPVDSLRSLLASMKPSFLIRENNFSLMRQVFIANSENPMVLLRKWDDTILIGTGFSEIENFWNFFPAFGDIRLPFSEKDRIRAWILTDENVDIERVFLILEALDFPPIFSTKNLIAKIRKSASPEKLAKIRFFEIFSNHFSEKISSFEFFLISKNHQKLLGFSLGERLFAYECFPLEAIHFSCEKDFSLIWKNFSINGAISDFSLGEVLEFSSENIEKKSMKFTFDTFYIDEKSIGTISGYALSDRKNLAKNGVLIFTLEEDENLRTISGHIFIDSRGFVHSHEMMKIHKEIIKAVRVTYERAVSENPFVERSELVKIFRSEIAKYAFVLTGRAPIVMPIIMSKKHF